MKIISKREMKTAVRYYRSFIWTGAQTSGFAFDCDEEGNVDQSDYTEIGRDNLKKCLDGTYDVIDEGIVKDEWTYVEHAVGLCECGEEVFLCSFTNTCECGADYDSGGHRLAPREQWGEETGESWYDCY